MFGEKLKGIEKWIVLFYNSFSSIKNHIFFATSFQNLKILLFFDKNFCEIFSFLTVSFHPLSSWKILDQALVC